MTDITHIKSPVSQMKAWRDGHTGWLVLDRPERKNALDEAMWRAIPPLMSALAGDRDIHVIVIRGAGPDAFAAGADISEFTVNRSGSSAARAYEQTNVEAFEAIANAPKPVIAMIHGYCIGGGLAIALACDMRIAADDAVFALPPARLGLAYPVEGLRQLLAAVSPSTAKEMIFTARRLNALEALRTGLINQAVATDQLEETVQELAATIAANAPLTIRASKLTINELTRHPQSPDTDLLERLSAECFESNDYAEGQKAFREKRKPVFKGD
ncbi:MAG TPA: enoyl-CoA hydratase [Rhizobiales bacterium]|nr:enoyl-CoA hydratase [Hyphomicrobiales bacterium]